MTTVADVLRLVAFSVGLAAVQPRPASPVTPTAAEIAYAPAEPAEGTMR